MKHILLATTGSSPQVLTETLYAIAQSDRPFPDEVYVITTGSTRQALINGLFRDGHLQALKDEYQLPDFRFDESHIWLMTDPQGEVLHDTQSPEEQAAAADFIIRQVFRLTLDEHCAIHASLAGGRKTTTFYFGYAMSLLGRVQDTLSHVFVDQAYEFLREFWYPTKTTRWVTMRDGQGEIDASLAQVRLVDIPFVRMRESVSPALIDSMGRRTFSEVVALINDTHASRLAVTLNPATRVLDVRGAQIILTPKEFAFYLWLYHKGETGVVVDRYFEEQDAHSRDFLNIYQHIGRDPRVFRSLGTSPEAFAADPHAPLSGMEKAFVQTSCSHILRKLKTVLPPQTVKMLEICAREEKNQYRYTLALFEHPVKITLAP